VFCFVHFIGKIIGSESSPAIRVVIIATVYSCSLSKTVSFTIYHWMKSSKDGKTERAVEDPISKLLL
jgi:hypothetical protein